MRVGARRYENIIIRGARRFEKVQEDTGCKKVQEDTGCKKVQEDTRCEKVQEGARRYEV